MDPALAAKGWTQDHVKVEGFAFGNEEETCG
jgi:hypothetical protein